MPVSRKPWKLFAILRWLSGREKVSGAFQKRVPVPLDPPQYLLSETYFHWMRAQHSLKKQMHPAGQGRAKQQDQAFESLYGGYTKVQYCGLSKYHDRISLV